MTMTITTARLHADEASDRAELASIAERLAEPFDGRDHDAFHARRERLTAQQRQLEQRIAGRRASIAAAHAEEREAAEAGDDVARILVALHERHEALGDTLDRFAAAKAIADQAAEASVQAAADRALGVEAAAVDEDAALAAVDTLERGRDRHVATIAELEQRLATAQDAADVAEQEALARQWAEAQGRLAEAWAAFTAANDELWRLQEADRAIARRRSERTGQAADWLRRLKAAKADAPPSRPALAPLDRLVPGLALEAPPAEGDGEGYREERGGMTP